MKQFTVLLFALLSASMFAQAPAESEDVMLQGFIGTRKSKQVGHNLLNKLTRLVKTLR